MYRKAVLLSLLMVFGWMFWRPHKIPAPKTPDATEILECSEGDLGKVKKGDKQTKKCWRHKKKDKKVK